MSVDIIIPVYNLGNDFRDNIKKLLSQTIRPHHIFLLQTVNDTSEPLVSFEEDIISVHAIRKQEFDHGATRHFGTTLSDAEYVMFMTQDAVPVDKKLIEELLKSFEDEKAAVAYARQLPRKDSDILERMTRDFNYPAKSVAKTKDDLDRLGIKTFFCSDVCAMYKKSIYDKLGGFVRKTIFNEDMIMASKFIHAGYSVNYCAEAKVIHSHSYTCMQQFHRNFDLGVSQKQYKEVFENISSEKEGAGFAKSVIIRLLKKGKIIKVFYFAIQCAFKLFGYKMGKNYDKLSKKMILKCTMNRGYWN